MHPRRKILTAIGATLCVTIGWLLYRNNWVINPSAHPAAEPVGANATLPGSNRQSQSDSIAAAANEKVRKAGDTAKESVYADWLRSITEALASRDDANSLAAAALADSFGARRPRRRLRAPPDVATAATCNSAGADGCFNSSAGVAGLHRANGLRSSTI